MQVTLPSALKDFVTEQVKSGEFDDASAVVSEAVRRLRDAHEAMAKMRAAFAAVDSDNGRRQASARDRALINELVKTHRANKRRA